MIDGVATSCGLAMGAVNAGAAVIGPASTTRWNSNLNNHQGGYQFFHAWADGTQGWSPFSWVPGISGTAASPGGPPSLKNVPPEEAARRSAMVAEFGRAGFGDEDVELTLSDDPQNTTPDPHGRSDKFLNCARKAGLGWLLTEDAWKNGHRFNDSNASFINQLSDATGVIAGLLGFTFDHEGRFDQQAAPNTNNSQDRGNWDFGPFQLNYYQTVRDSFHGDYSVAGIDLDAAFGRLGTSTLDPSQNGMLAGRKLAWLVHGAHGDLGLAAGRFTAWSGGRFTSRVNDWNSQGSQFQKFFDCFTDR